MKSLVNGKKLVVFILAILFVLCTYVGLVANKASADGNLETVALETTMEQGAQMRLDDPTGMRFVTNVAKSDLTKFNAENVKVVVMITQKNLLDAAKISITDFNKDSAVTKGEVTFNANELPETNGDVIKLTATILEVGDLNISKTYVAKAYITDGESIGYVGQAATSSIYAIASEMIDLYDPVEDAKAYNVLARYSKSCNITIEGMGTEKVPYGIQLSDVFGTMPECHKFTSIKDAEGNDVEFDAAVTSDLTLVLEYEHKYVDGKCGCGVECAHETWNDNACANCGVIADVENYDGVVYVQYDGKIEGIEAQQVIINGKIVDVESGYANADQFAAAIAGVELGADLTIYVPDFDQMNFVKATAKYVTIAISNYEELTHIDDNLGANYFILANDIDCDGNEWINERNDFHSTLDGNGYVIKNLLIAHEKSGQHNGYSDGSFVGTYGWNAKFITAIGGSGVIKNIVFDNVSFKGNSSVITKTAFIGLNLGIVENVVMSIGSPDCDGFGGLVGQNDGTIKNCALDYSRQVQWTMGYISTINNGTIENVSVNIPSVFTIDQFKLVGTDNGTSTNCAQLAKTQREMYSYITDSAIKVLYGKITFEEINALSRGTKATIDFNGKTVNGYTVNMDYATTFQFTQDYINDLKMRDVVGVKVWAKCSGYLYMPPKTEGALGGSDRTDWQDYSTWKAINIGRNFSQENNDNMPAAYYNRVFSDTVITPEQLALFDVGCAVNPSDTVYIYIEEFTADTVPVVSGKEYTTRTETIGEQDVIVYRVEFNSNNTSSDQNNAISGFMISEGYLDKMANEGYTSISLMVKTDGLLSTSIGYRIGDANWQSDWRNNTVLSDWTVINHTITNAPYTIAQAKDLHISGLEGNGLPYPTYVEFYIVANK